MKRKIVLKCIIILFLLCVLITGVCEELQSDIKGAVVRLHIIANSDTQNDQSIKLAVRDAVIAKQEEIFPNGIKESLSREEKDKILKTANDTLKSHNAPYKAEIFTGEFYFPTKKYENITLPAGNYNGVKIVLGEGKGQNWWCVMYPPLCFADSTVGTAGEKSKKLLKEKMGEFSYEIISQESIKTVPAIKLVEIWQEIKEKITRGM